jgi:hypothetical protein
MPGSEAYVCTAYWFLFRFLLCRDHNVVNLMCALKNRGSAMGLGLYLIFQIKAFSDPLHRIMWERKTSRIETADCSSLVMIIGQTSSSH